MSIQYENSSPNQRKADDIKSDRISSIEASVTNNFDSVRSYRQFDRTGPNPDPLYCYLQKSMICQNGVPPSQR